MPQSKFQALLDSKGVLPNDQLRGLTEQQLQIAGDPAELLQLAIQRAELSRQEQTPIANAPQPGAFEVLMLRSKAGLRPKAERIKEDERIDSLVGE